MYLGNCVYCNGSVSDSCDAVAIDVFEVAHTKCMNKHIEEVKQKEIETEEQV